MKTECDKCGARYRIPEEKLEGKQLRIRCRKCDHIFTVRDMSSAPSQQSLETMERFTGAYPAVSANEEREWYYAVQGQSYGPYSSSELIDRFEQAKLTDECHVWKTGLTAWVPSMQVPDFAAAIESAQVTLPGFNPPLALSDTPMPTRNSGRSTIEVRHPGATLAKNATLPQSELDTLDDAFASAFGDQGRQPARGTNRHEATADAPIVDTLTEQIQQATLTQSTRTGRTIAHAAGARESHASTKSESDDASDGDSSPPPQQTTGSSSAPSTLPRANTAATRTTSGLTLPSTRAPGSVAELPRSKPTSGLPTPRTSTLPRPNVPARPVTGSNPAVPAASVTAQSDVAASPASTGRPSTLPRAAATGASAPARKTLGMSSLPPVRPSGIGAPTSATRTLAKASSLPLTKRDAADDTTETPTTPDDIQAVIDAAVTEATVDTAQAPDDADAKALLASKLPSGVDPTALETTLGDDEDTFIGVSEDSARVVAAVFANEPVARELAGERLVRQATQEINIEDFLEEISDILRPHADAGTAYDRVVATQINTPVVGIPILETDDDIAPPLVTTPTAALVDSVEKAPRKKRRSPMLYVAGVLVIAGAALFVQRQANAKREAREAEEQRIAQEQADLEAQAQAAAENLLHARNRASSAVALAIGRAERAAQNHVQDRALEDRQEVAQAVVAQRTRSAPAARPAAPPEAASVFAANQVAPPPPATETSTRRGSQRGPNAAYFQSTLRGAVASSVGRCAQRARAMNGGLNFSRLELSITIRSDGAVERIGAQRALRDSAFMNCMNTESTRWKFASFEGNRTTISHSFVVQ